MVRVQRLQDISKEDTVAELAPARFALVLPSTGAMSLIALSCDSRAEVNDLVSRAVAAGGTTPNEPKDMGFMFQHGFADPDGHQWEVFYMDEAAVPAQL